MYSPLYVRMRRDVACPHPLTVSHMCGCATSLRVRTHVSCCRTRNPIACPHYVPHICADTQDCCVSARCSPVNTPHKIIQSVHALHNHYSYTSPKCKNLHRSRLSAPSRSPNHPSVSARPIPHLLQHSFSHTIVNSFPSDHNDINILTHPM